MASKTELRNKVLIQLAASPYTLFPFAGGVTALLANWTFNWNSGICIFASIAGLLVSCGIFTTRLLLGAKSATKKAWEELQKEAQKERDKRLDDLEARLCEDNDPRDENYLMELRELVSQFHDSKWADSLNASLRFEITGKVDEIFQNCIAALERSLDLLQEAEGKDPRTRICREVRKQREDIIKSVQKSTEKISGILTEITALNLRDNNTSELNRLTQELDQSLEVAKKVDQRMREEFGGIEEKETE